MRQLNVLPAPKSYVIDVCRYCGRLAQWPGCDHWQKHEGWTMAVKVTLADGDRARLQAAMENG